MTESSAEQAGPGAGGSPVDAVHDPAYREAVVELLGAIAYGELSAFERLAEDAKLAPTLADKVAIGQMAAAEFGHLTRLTERLESLGADPFAAMEPFQKPFDAFHARTAPADWLEGLVKAYVGDGLAADFYREVAAFLDADTRNLIIESLSDAGQSAFVVDRVRRAIADDHRVGGRLALWGRRLMGEALSQAQRVAAERAELIGLIAAEVGDQAGLMALFKRLTTDHAARMTAVGLNN